MTTIFTIQVDSDGVLKLTLPMEPKDANKTVRVTIETVDESVESAIPKTREEWLQFIARTAGSIDDPTFIRQPQGEFEERDPL